jgi:hypothetical protein
MNFIPTRAGALGKVVEVNSLPGPKTSVTVKPYQESQ